MDSFKSTIEFLASGLTAAPQNSQALVEELDRVLGRRWQWTRTLVERYLTVFDEGPRPRSRQVAAFLAADRGLRRAFRRYRAGLRARQPPRILMAPRGGPPSDWRVPPITTTAELAGLLGVKAGELDWLADVGGWNRQDRDPRLHHYHYRVVRKQGRGVRLIEAPKVRLKAVQRWILREILDYIPPHDAVHGFRHERSIHTFVAPHVGQPAVLKLDLQDFFPTIRAPQIDAIFRTAGYPEAVADCLTGLCTTATPESVWECESGAGTAVRWEVLWLYRERHLPQGAPTSPALANLAAFRLDTRLSALARRCGATYTRYADDLAFSGGESFARHVKRFYVHAAATIEEEGFRPQYRKTRIMRPGVRQQVAGLVLNRRVNVRRDEYERLKATLFNCIRRGPASQNRHQQPDYRAHLLGRIAHVSQTNEGRGNKLRALFDRIEWEQ